MLIIVQSDPYLYTYHYTMKALYFNPKCEFLYTFLSFASPGSNL